jgi:putative SOS response-associated peptidase YedK
MCGRFSLTATPEEIRELFSLLDIEDFPARYNIAPTQPILVIISDETPAKGSNSAGRKAVLARWGLIPGWVKDPKDFPLLLNARSETAIDKASFRAAMRHRRILVPASGFYEWHRPAKESGGKSQAYWVRPKHGGLIAFAGLMETYASADGSELDTAAILITRANASFAPIHDRLPVVIDQQDFARWLDCKTQEPREVEDLLTPVDDDFFEAIPVSDRVNKVSNMGPDLQIPVEPEMETPAKNTKNPSKSKAKRDQMTLF